MLPMRGCFSPGVLRPLATYCSRRALSAATLSGFFAYRLFCSAGSSARLKSCMGGASSGAWPGLGWLPPPDPLHRQSFQSPWRMAKAP